MQFNTLIEYIESKAQTRVEIGPSSKTLHFTLKGINGLVTRSDSQRVWVGQFYRSHEMRVTIKGETIIIEGLKAIEAIFNIFLENENIDEILLKTKEYLANIGATKSKREIEKILHDIGQKVMALSRELENLGEMEEFDLDDTARIETLRTEILRLNKLLAENPEENDVKCIKADSLSSQLYNLKIENRSIRLDNMQQGLVLILRNKNRDDIINKLKDEKRIERIFKVGI